MPAVALRLAASPPAPAHPKAVIVTEKGNKVILPYAPEDAELTGFGWQWQPQDRTDRKPLVRRAGRQLKRFTYTPTLVHADGTDVEPTLTALRYIADLGLRVSWTGMGPSQRGLYRFSLDAIRPTRLEAGTNNILECQVSLTFLEAVDAVSKVGPLTGGSGGATGTGVGRAPIPITSSTNPGFSGR